MVRTCFLNNMGLRNFTNCMKHEWYHSTPCIVCVETCCIDSFTATTVWQLVMDTLLLTENLIVRSFTNLNVVTKYRMNKNACCVKHKKLTSITRWKIEIGSSLRKLMEQATEFRLRLRSTGDGPSPGKVSLNTATLWHTWGYSGSTAKLNRKMNHNTYLRPTEQTESKIFYTFI